MPSTTPGPAPAPVRTARLGAYALDDLVRARAGRRVAVCLPARDEATTVGPIVAGVVDALTLAGGGADLVDEVVVVDDGSVDDTAAVARRAGARVVRAAVGAGKGQAMALALQETDAELLVFLDADVENFEAHFVTGLLGPLLVALPDGGPDVLLVKGFYERPLHGEPTGGGRVTELVARPLIDLLFPHLAGVRQPLAGETAAPRTVLDKTGFAPGYGVELGLLVDVAEHFGVEHIAQVDLGVRVHRNRPLLALRPQATDVVRAALERAGVPRG
ncbi:MAG: glucosyl-3-phosphoglycerate synthase [Acidimicrobiales bacterium]